MEFAEIVQGEKFHFSALNRNTFLVSGQKAEYILYKTDTWRCAELVQSDLIEELGETIDGHLQFLK